MPGGGEAIGSIRFASQLARVIWEEGRGKNATNPYQRPSLADRRRWQTACFGGPATRAP